MSVEELRGGVMCVSPVLQTGKRKRVRFGSVTIIPIPRRHQLSLSSSCDTLDSPRSPSQPEVMNNRSSTQGEAVSSQLPLFIPPPLLAQLPSQQPSTTPDTPLLVQGSLLHEEDRTDIHKGKNYGDDMLTSTSAESKDSNVAMVAEETATQPPCTLSGNEDELLVALRRSNTSTMDTCPCSSAETPAALLTEEQQQQGPVKDSCDTGCSVLATCDTAAWLGTTTTTTIVTSPRCAFCCNAAHHASTSNAPLLHDDTPNGTSQQYYYHALCAAWCPEVYYDPSKQRFCHVQAALDRCAEIKCALCRQPGASIGCASPECQLSYHLPCAQQARNATIDASKYVFYCPTHRPVKCGTPCEKRRRQTRKRGRT